MNRQIKIVFTMFIMAFLAVGANIFYIQLIDAENLEKNAFNKRRLVEEYAIQRGDIVTDDQVVIATSEDTGTEYRWQRRYPLGAAFSCITGYDSWKYGRWGLEATCNNELLGKDTDISIRSLGNMLFGTEERGNSIRITVNSRLQQVANDALAGVRGAVVALDPATGAVLAMASGPGYDPNVAVTGTGEQWEAITDDRENSPLFNRATQGLYPPGSAFKPVVAGAALDMGLVNRETTFSCGGKYIVNGYPIYDFNKANHGEISFLQAMVKSCNITFAQVGGIVGAEALTDYAERFGFNAAVPFDLQTATSSIASTDRMTVDPVELATASFGQGDDLASPLQMALVAATIANGGVAMKPYLVEEVRDYNGKIVKQVKVERMETVLSAEAAQALVEMMKQVVENGTGTGAAVKGLGVAGKTGTAEVAGAPSHSWFICFAPTAEPGIAIAVIVENGGQGGEVAAPIARRLLLEAEEQGLL